MGGKNAPLEPEESVRGVLRVLSAFDVDRWNGNFVDYQGEIVEW
jgi:hypothetical protein